MRSAGGETASFATRIRARVGNPLNWSLADRCLMGAAWQLFYLTSGLVVLHWLLARRPDTAPFLDHAALARLAPLNIGLVAGWWVIACIALALRWWAPSSRWLQ